MPQPTNVDKSDTDDAYMLNFDTKFCALIQVKLQTWMTLKASDVFIFNILLK
jgi:hypothetical protein